MSSLFFCVFDAASVAIGQFASMPLSFRCLLVVFCCEMKADVHDVHVLNADVTIARCFLMLPIVFFAGWLLSFLSFVVHKFGTV
jgi:hypothetical protein